jgi:hypothetical protein
VCCTYSRHTFVISASFFLYSHVCICAPPPPKHQVSGVSLDDVTPFQTATLIAGPDESPSSSPVALLVSDGGMEGEIVYIQDRGGLG